ncbi:hypothetical protein CC80DRAFT_466166 [Byssothecium circinans]|uniref:Ima1 N-terminal domain-containing protein n=1 Tax=Byssothecium circinans TaxID=147558 RepID=A0A6A5U686_9PLEO|nr:hypothetical protein CC80DRAFT_466166 [Byssothecium circinans]
MVRLLRRNLRCHYCNLTSRNEHGGIPRQWLCPNCDATNYLDERGNVTDPPIEATASAAHSLQYARSRSPTPTMHVSSSLTNSPFCETCQHNQFLLNKTIAEYIPDEDDPQYAQYVKSADEYRAELEERYPQVCEDCIDRVQERIRAAGYAAKADHLRRRLEQSKKYKVPENSLRQVVTLAVICIAKWFYLVNVFFGLLWHTLGMMASPDRDRDFDLGVCFKQALFLRGVGESCFNSPDILQLVKYALLADLFTIWWNPKLKQKTNRPGGRMRGLKTVWFLRLVLLSGRSLAYFFLTDVDRESQKSLHYTHGAIFALLIWGTIRCYNTVRIHYHSTRTLMQPLDAHLPSVSQPSENSNPTTCPTTRPINSSFDTMAQSFTSSFTGGPSSANPPSPTLTIASVATEDSEWATPYNPRKTSRTATDIAMDWTPTPKRFSNNAPTVLPHTFTPKREPSPPPAPNFTPHSPPSQGHSIFAQPDPNPFRHKVPAPPRGSLLPKTARVDPWNAPGTTHVPHNFFNEAKKFGEASQRDVDWSVPRNVKRQDELFASPKLKYHTNAYGKQGRDTGLEAGFNDLFSK